MFKSYRYLLCGFFAGLILIFTATPFFTSLSAQNDRTGYINRTGVGLLTGNSGNNIRLQMTHGYRFTERLSAGVGSGYVFYRDPLDLIPVFIELTYLFGDDGVAPFIQLKTGYSFSVLHDRSFEPDRHRGGPLLNPGLGLQIKNSSAPGIYLSAGFNLDTSTFEQDSFGDRIIKDSISYRRISLSFGFVF